MPSPPPPSMFPKMGYLEEDRSEQLPSVEEAKMAATSDSFKKKESSGIAATSNDDDLVLDVDSFYDIKHSETDKTVEVDEETSAHDQLPHLDEAKLYSRRSSSSGQRRCGTKAKVCGFFVLFLVAGAVLAMALVLMPTDEEAPRAWSSTTSSSGEQFTTEPPATDMPTASPTSAPSAAASEVNNVTEPETTMPLPDDRYGRAIHLLSDGVSSLFDLQTKDSSQQRAAWWIAYKDALQMPLTLENKESVVQRYVLALLYFAMGGENWNKQLSFLSGQNECSWNIAEIGQGFAEDKVTMQIYGVTCYRSGVVQKLHFPTSSLVGNFPQEIQHLKDLEHLDVFHNPGIGPGGFPAFLKGMPRLKYLGLHYCELGPTPIPEWVGTLTALETLALSNNDFTGTLPQSLLELFNLEDLFLDDNHLEGTVNMFSQLSNLKHLVLEDNHFTGQLDNSMFSELVNLEVFDASSNPIKSAFPTEAFAIETLRVLDLHSCEIYGPIPPFYLTNSVDTSLEVLVLANNSISGAIASQMSELTALKQFDVSRNQLTSLGSGFGDLAQLEYFFAALNPIAAGEIPSFFSTMTSLRDLSLKNTNRIGSIPDWIGSLTNLKLLDLDNNALVGSIPDTISELSELEYLLLNRNMLQGSLPANMELLTSLDFLLLDKNNITGNAETVCVNLHAPKTFIADCAGVVPELECRCCSKCCDDNDVNCNNQVWLDDINPIWELGYADSSRSFDAGTDQVYTVVFRGGVP